MFRHFSIVVSLAVLTILGCRESIAQGQGAKVGGGCGHVIGYRVAGPSRVATPLMPFVFPVFTPPLRPIIGRSPATKRAPADDETAPRRAKNDSAPRAAKAGTAKPSESRPLELADRRQFERERSAYVFDSATGEIRWPALFQDAPFAQQREAVDALVSGENRATPERRREAVAALNQIKTSLQERIREIKPQTYCQASRFLRDLRVQLSLPPGA